MHVRFLTPYTRKEAFAKGISFNNKEKHEILQLVDDHSNAKRAKDGALLKIQEVQAAIKKYPESTVARTLIELKLDNMIVPLPCIEFDPEEQNLKATVFVASLHSNRNADLTDVYDALLDRCTEEIGAFLDSVNWYDRDLFWKDLDASLMEDENSDVFYPHIFFDIEHFFKNLDIPFSIDPDMIHELNFDLQHALVTNHLAVDTGDGQIFLYNESKLDEISQALSSFFRNRILPQYESAPTVCRELEVIDKQEELYKSNKNNHNTFSFVEARARAVFKHLSQDVYTGHSLFPGRLPLLLIGKLEGRINETYEKDHIEEVFAQYREIKKRLFSQSTWKELVLFLPRLELQLYYKKTIEKLKLDKDILNTTWYENGEPYLVLIGLNIEHFYEVLEGMKTLPNKEAWKVLTFRSLLENSAKIKPEINPFYDKKFSTTYGKLLKAAYSANMSFLYHILLSLKIGFIDKWVFQSVKSKVAEKQRIAGEKFENLLNTEKMYRRGDEEKQNAYIRRLITRNRILEEMDFFYFKQDSIPSANDILTRFPNLSETDFKQLLQDFDFQLIPVRGQETWKNKILFYPKSASWKHLTTKTSEKISHLLDTHRKGSKYGTEDPVFLDRLKAVKYLLQSETAAFKE